MRPLNHSLAMDMSHLYSSERGLSDSRLHLIEGHGDTIYLKKERALAEWEETLAPRERAVLKTARDVYLHFPLEGGCYHTAFFLACYLKERFGLDGQAVVGCVDDGLTKEYYSHAWYVLNGRITDITISRPAHPKYHWRGPLTILGQEVAPGWQWNYHPGKKFGHLLQLRPEQRTLHLKMVSVAKSYACMRAYLDNAIAGYTYAEMAARLDRLSSLNPA